MSHQRQQFAKLQGLRLLEIFVKVTSQHRDQQIHTRRPDFGLSLQIPNFERETVCPDLRVTQATPERPTPEHVT